MCLALVAVLVAGTTFSGGAGAAKSPPPTAPARVVQTIVLPSEILAGQDSAAFPFTSTQPPTEGVAGYTVPDDKRLVVESAYVFAGEQFTDPADHRTGLAVSLATSYALGGACLFPGYERDYPFRLDPVVVRSDESRQGGSLQGPIYVEGGRVLQMAASTVDTTQSQVIVFVTVHGYLEPAVNPLNPAPPTFGCE